MNVSLVILLASLHTGGTYSDKNYGVGIEHTSAITIGAYVYNNSFNKTSYMLSASKQYKMFGFGVAVATGYEKEPLASSGIMIAPELSLSYSYFRLKTTAPFGALAGAYDVFNLQFVYDLDGVM